MFLFLPGLNTLENHAKDPQEDTLRYVTPRFVTLSKICFLRFHLELLPTAHGNSSVQCYNVFSKNLKIFLQECKIDRYRHEQCEEHNSDTTKYRAHFLGGIVTAYVVNSSSVVRWPDYFMLVESGVWSDCVGPLDQSYIHLLYLQVTFYSTIFPFSR